MEVFSFITTYETHIMCTVVGYWMISPLKCFKVLHHLEIYI